MNEPYLLRPCNAGQTLDVAGLNEITVLIDRSETELTEVGMNKWAPGLDGPPHAHDRKEQNFFVTAGSGTVRIGEQTYEAKPGAFFYLPAGLEHQSVGQGDAPLCYLLFNAFLGADKEGHGSFADHIAKVKSERRRQADTQRARDASGPAAAPAVSPYPGKRVDTERIDARKATLLGREESQRCEAVHYRLGPDEELSLPAELDKEQTFFVCEGSGSLVLHDQSAPLEPSHVCFAPRGAARGLRSGAEGLRAIAFGTLLDPAP